MFRDDWELYDPDPAMSYYSLSYPGVIRACHRHFRGQVDHVSCPQGRIKNVQERRAFIKRWAEYVRTHDDEEWSRQQNKLIDSQRQSANEMASAGDTDPIAFARAREQRRTDSNRR